MDGYDKARVISLFILTGLMAVFVLQEMKFKKLNFEKSDKDWNEYINLLATQISENKKPVETKPHLETVKDD